MSGDNCDENAKQDPINEDDNQKRKHFWDEVRAAFDSVPPWQRRLAEVAVLALYFLHEAHDDWPHSHGLALFYGALGTCVVLLIELPFKWWLVASSGIAISCLIFFSIVGPIPETKPVPQAPPVIVTVPGIGAGVPRTFEGGPGIPFEDAEVRGVLKPANEPTPPNGCDDAPFPIKPDALKILIGDGAIIHNGFGSFTAIGIGACRALSMERRMDGIFVNASLYDQEKQRVVSIENNQITALHGENYTAQQSRDESRLTVKGKSGTELFYIRYLNPMTVQFRGFLGCMGGRIVHVEEGQPVPGYFMSRFCFGLLSSQGVGIQIGRP